MTRTLPLAVCLFLATGDFRDSQERPQGVTVVFACEHGTVKSLIASEWFNRQAAARGLAVRSVSRGVEPDASVPPAIVTQLGRDGFDVRRFEPRALAPADLDGAIRLVMIGVAPPSWAEQAEVPVERWDDVPAASKDYTSARDVLRARIAALLRALPRSKTR